MSPSERATLQGPARECSDDPSVSVCVIGNAVAYVEDLIVASVEEVPTVVAQKSLSSVEAPQGEEVPQVTEGSSR